MAYEKKYAKRNIAKVVVTGNIGKVKDLKYFDNGDCVLNFSVACSQDYTKDDKIIEQTIWWECVLKGKRAESIAKSKVLPKVKGICVVGHMLKAPRVYEANGQHHAALQIDVDDMDFLSWKENDGNEDDIDEDDDDDDIPF